MLPEEHFPTAFEMMDDMADMAEKVSALEKLNRLFHDGINQLNETRWGAMGSEACYVPRLERHVRGLQ